MHNQSYEPSFDFQPDSFDQPHPSDNEYQIQNREVPAAIPSDHYIGNVNGRGQDDRKLRNGKNKKQLGYGEENNGYQVTFKKYNNKFKSLRSTNEVKANLFTKQQFNNNEANIIKSRSSRTKQINLQNNPQSQQNHNRIQNAIQISHTVQQLFTNILNPPIIVPLSMLEYSLQSLLQSDQIISQVAQLKIQTLLNFINLKNLRKKRNSVNINLAIMVVEMDIQTDDDNSTNLDNRQTKKSNDKGKNNNNNNINCKKATVNKKEFTEADRKKMQILSLLKIQLDKKIFIQALKFQRLRSFCDKVLKEVAEDGQNANQEEDQMQVQQQNNPKGQLQQQQQHNEFLNNNKQPPATSPTPNYSPTHNNPPPSSSLVPSSSAYYQQSRLTVFTQILGSLLNTRIFYPCFKIIKNNKKNTRIFTETDQLGKYIVAAHQHNNQNDYEQQQQYNENDDGDEYEQVYKDPVIAIEQYIEQLKQNYIKNPLNSAQLMRNYFLRWKIYFLTSIVNKIQSQLSVQQEPYQQQQYQHLQQEQHLEQKNAHNKKRHNHPNPNLQQQLQHQYQILNQYASNKSLQSNIASLKDQKHRLKQYIQIKRTKQFYNICRENIANKNIKQVMNGFYQRNLKMRVIEALWQNKQQTVIQQNAEFWAQNQNQEENMTALIFYRTNILAKSFFGLKKLMKCSKFSKITQNLLIKKSYQALKYETAKQRDNEIKLEKFLQRKRRQILFKCFNGIKSETSYSNQTSSKIEGFKCRKQDQIVQLCFSALSLAWKKRLAKIQKIENLRTINSIKIFLFNLQDNITDKIQQQDLHLNASYIVLYNKKCQFMSNLKKDYVKFLNTKKLSIQSTKLEINRTYKQAHTMLSNWHKSYTHLKNYDLIEQKLKRVKQHEQKQKLLKIWHERLLQKFRQKRKDKLTTNHKIWLNKYYQKLCAIDQDVQDSGNQDLN